MHVLNDIIEDIIIIVVIIENYGKLWIMQYHMENSGCFHACHSLLYHVTSSADNHHDCL